MKTFLKQLIKNLFANLEREISTSNLVPIRAAQEQNPRRLNSGFQDTLKTQRIINENFNRCSASRRLASYSRQPKQYNSRF
ncbi:MAG: hypothetical protein ACTSXL_02655 [Alphaproteobacteria bacterium]